MGSFCYRGDNYRGEALHEKTEKREDFVVRLQKIYS